MLAERTASKDIVSQASRIVEDYWLNKEVESARSMATLAVEELMNNSYYSDYMLPETGFDMKLQMGLWACDVAKSTYEGEAFEEAHQEAFSKIVEDVEAFYWEYLKRTPVLPLKLGFSTIDGKQKLIAQQYGNVPYGDVVSSDERGGASLDGVRKVIQALEETPQPVFAILTSPPGWSGIGGEYKESQTYLFRKSTGNTIDAITIRSNMGIVENEDLLDWYRGSTDRNNLVSEIERIQRVAGNPVIITDSGLSFEDVILSIQRVSGGEVLFRDPSTHKKWGYGEVLDMVRSREEIFDISREADVKRIADSLGIRAGGVSNLSPESVYYLSVEIGKSILEIAELTRGYQKTMVSGIGGSNLSYVQQMSGCAGGGMAGLRRRFGSGEKKFIHNCGNCGRELKAFMRAGDTCPYCKQEYLGC